MNASATPPPDFDSFYQEILRTARSQPREAWRALEALDPGSLGAYDRLRWHRLRAHVCMSLGRIEQSLSEYEHAWRGFLRAGDGAEAGITGIGYVAMLGFAGRVLEALEIAQKARGLLPRDDRTRRARLLANEGNLLFLTGRYDEATRAFDRAAQDLERVALPLDAALARYNYGHACLYRGRTDRARAAFARILPVFEAKDRTTQVLYVEFCRIFADVLDGKWAGALLGWRDIEERMRGLGDLRAAANMAMERAELLLRLGADAPAEDAARSALEDFRRLGIERGAANVRFLLGRTLARTGRTFEAMREFEASRSALAELRDDWAHRRVGLELAGVRIAAGHAEEALDLLRRDARRDGGHEGALVRLRSRHLEAEAELAGGDASSALASARRAYRFSQRPLLRQESPSLALLCARAALRSQRTNLARRWLDRAVREQHDHLVRTRGEVAIQGETAGELRFREHLLRVALHDGPLVRPRRLLQWTLQLRPTSTPPRRARERTSGEIAGLRDRWLGLTDGRGDAARLRALEQRLQERLQQEPDRSKTELRDDPLDGIERLGDRQLVMLLVEDSRKSDSPWHALVVRDGRVRHVELPHAGEALRRSWIPFRLVLEQAAHISANARDRYLQQTEAEGVAVLDELRSRWWDPLALRPGRVVFVPDPVAQGIPFEALGGVEDFMVSRLPHPRYLSRPRKRVRARGGSALVLHDGNAGPRAEAEIVQRELRRAGISARRDSRSKAITTGRETWSLLHVAAHGVYHREQWLLNGIRLRDGWMGMEALRSSRIRDALLVFSSCDSGLVHNAPGGQLGGWAEAGLDAGAREMILTLWKIPDEFATRFAKTFYPAWAQGASVEDAARQARRALRLHCAHPFAWAPFTSVARG